MTEHTIVVRCSVRGCCFAILKRDDDDTPWVCPQHRDDPYDVPGLPPPDDDDDRGAA